MLREQCVSVCSRNDTYLLFTASLTAARAKVVHLHMTQTKTDGVIGGRSEPKNEGEQR
jgi:hypothetical protein